MSDYRNLTPADLNNIATGKPIKKWEEQLDNVFVCLHYAAERGRTAIEVWQMEDWVKDQLIDKGFYVEFRVHPISKTLVYFGTTPWEELSTYDQYKAIQQ